MAFRVKSGRALTIANGGTTTNSIEIDQYEYFALAFPAAFTGVSVSIQGSYDNSTFVTINGVTITPVTSEAVPITGTDRESISAFRFIKFVSASAEGAARSLTFYMG